MVSLYDQWVSSNASVEQRVLQELSKSVYHDSDIPSRLPPDLSFSP